jgi:hypothetical protein
MLEYRDTRLNLYVGARGGTKHAMFLGLSRDTDAILMQLKKLWIFSLN